MLCWVWVYAGSYADFTASKKEWLAKVTDRFPLDTGGGVPLVSLTAMQVTHPADPPSLPPAHLRAVQVWGACKCGTFRPMSCGHQSRGTCRGPESEAQGRSAPESSLGRQVL